MKTAILMPVYRAAKFINVTFASLYRLDPQPDIYIFLENNSPDNTIYQVARFHRPKEINRLWFRDDALEILKKEGGTPYDIIGMCRQFLLDRARKLDMDYAIFIDADIRVQSRDLIERLTGWADTDIIGGLYNRVYPQGLLLASLWPSPIPNSFQLRNSPISNEPKEEVMATSGGCLCLSRRIMAEKNLNFYPVDRPYLGIGPVSEDYGYVIQAGTLGFKCWVDTTVKLDHWIKEDHIQGKAWRVNADGQPCQFRYEGR